MKNKKRKSERAKNKKIMVPKNSEIKRKITRAEPREIEEFHLNLNRKLLAASAHYSH